MKGEKEFIVTWRSVFYNPSYFIRKRLYTSIRSIAPMLNGDILDFGCGSKPYKHLFTNAKSYIGLDIKVSGHDHTNEQIDIYYDGKVIPFENNRFDSIFSTEVFEHIFDIDNILPEINRVLKSDGYLLITCPFVCPEHEKPYDFARYTSFGIKHILQKHGFTVEKQIKTGNFIEATAQLHMYFMNFILPKRPYLLYVLLYQIFILPCIIGTTILNNIAPKKLKRDDLYHSNVVLAKKN